MRDSSASIWRVLHEGDPLVVVLYPDTQARQDLVEQVGLLAPDGMDVRTTQDVAEAFSALDTLLLLAPQDEPAALLVLDGRRDALLARRVPAVLFLLRGGEATRQFHTADLAGLMSWLRGRIIDPEALDQIDPEDERQRFVRDLGLSPVEWLKQWKAGQIEDTLANNLLSYRAALLVEG